MKKLRDDLPVEQIADNVYWINEFEGTNCYLIVGEKEALLIDSGTGFCDLRGCCKKITDKPITLVLTHGHVDHLGGAGQFREAYVHPFDMGRVNELQKSKLARQIFLLYSNCHKLGFKASDVFDPDYDTKYIQLHEGQVFDLGGKIVRVKYTPGHSKGSVSFVDETDKIVFCGDNMCDSLWMFMPGATSIEEWIPSAQWLYDMSADYRIFWGHRKPELDRTYIEKVLNWGKHILIIQGGHNDKRSKIKQFPDQSDGIIYRTGNVYKK